MTEHKWLNFASFLSACSYGLENPNCPFLKIQQLDQYQRLEWLVNIDENEAEKLFRCCKEQRNYCSKPVRHQALKSLELELVS
jgi:hypothetical protein